MPSSAIAPSEPDPRYALVLAEAIRGLEGQKGSVDELRSRVGILLSAASVATAFLGGAALKAGSVGWMSIAAVVTFAVSVALDLYILQPRTWTFHTGAKVLTEQWIDKRGMSTHEMQRWLAKYLDDYWDKNQLLLNHLWTRYKWAIRALEASILFWLVELAGLADWLRGVVSP